MASKVPHEKGRKRSALPRGVLAAMIASAVMVALLAGGITLALVLKNRIPDVGMPATEAELRSSVPGALDYLNAGGRKLAEGRTDGLTIYSVEATLDSKKHAVSGEEVLLYTNRTGQDLSEVVFRVYANSPSVRGRGGEVSIDEAEAEGRPVKASLEGSLLTLALTSRLAPGDSALLSFSFTEPVPELDTGLGSMLGGPSSGGYGVFGYSEDTYDLGYFVPSVASFSNGSWENREVPAFGDAAYSDCAVFNVAIDVPGSFVVAATGVKKQERSGGGRRVYYYTAGPARDFAAQASPSYAVIERKVGRTVVASYHYSGSRDAGAKVLDFACGAVSEYSKHIGQYPYKRLNVCEAPLAGGAAGMEFTGQIQIAQVLYGELGIGELGMPEELKGLGEQFEDLLSPLAGGLLADTLEFVVTHEVCHQWFAITVGSDSLAHPWQDESLVNFLTVACFRWRHGESAASRVTDSQLLLPYQAMGLTGGGDMPADSPVEAFENQEQYTAVVYSKGALFFGELEKLMGIAAFEKSLSDYYEEYAFLEATPKELLEAFESNANDPGALSSLHQRWILEAHGDEDIPDAAGLRPLEGLLDYLREHGAADMSPLKEYFDKLKREGGLDMDLLDDLLDDLFKEPASPDETAPRLPGKEPSPVI